MSTPTEIFRRYCKANGMRFTPERQVIIEEAYRKDAHFDIESLFARIHQRHPNLKLAKASVYRTIPHLVQAGLVRESYLDSGRVCYEHILGHTHHDHMKCLRCGKVREFCDSKIDEAEQKISRGENFKVVRHMHVLFGYCAACQEKMNKPAKEGAE